MSDLSSLSDDEFLQLYQGRKSKSPITFKNNDVSSEFEQLAPEIKQIAMLGPARVTSGYRTPEENARVGGTPNSYHTRRKAFDVGIETDPETIQKYKDSGLQVLKEKDHYHVEPSENWQPPNKKNLSSLSDEEFSRLYNQRKSSPSQVQINSGKTLDSDKLFDNPVGTGLRNFAKSATFGLSEPIAAGGSALVEEALQALGKVPERSLGDSYDYYRDKNRESIAEQGENNPSAALAGEIGGYVSPGTALSKLYGGASKLANKVIPVAAAGVKRSLARRGGEELLRAGLRGGASGGIVGAIDPDQEALEGAKYGAVGDAVLSTLGAPVRAAGRSLNRVLKQGIDTGKAQALVEGTPWIGNVKRVEREAEEAAAKEGFNRVLQTFNENEAARKAAYLAEKSAAREFLKTIPKKNVTQAGESLKNAASEAEFTAGKAYKDVVNPLFNKYADRTANVDDLKKGIDSLLEGQGLVKGKKLVPGKLVDSSGTPLRVKSESTGFSGKEEILAPERKQMVNKLIEIRQRLNKKLTVGDLDRLTKDIQSLAGFDKLSRSGEDKIFGSLSRQIKEALLNSIEKVSEQGDAAAIKAARAAYAENQPVFKQLRSIKRKYPEQVVKTSSSQLPGTFIKEAITKQPSLKAPIADVIVNNIVQKSRTPQALTKALDDYGRDALKKVLDEQTFNVLLQAEKRAISASLPFQKGMAPEMIKKPIGKTYRSFRKSLDFDLQKFLKKKLGERAPIKGTIGQIMSEDNKGK